MTLTLALTLTLTLTKWLAPEDVVHTTFGTAAHDPKAAHLDLELEPQP